MSLWMGRENHDNISGSTFLSSISPWYSELQMGSCKDIETKYDLHWDVYLLVGYGPPLLTKHVVEMQITQHIYIYIQ